VLEFKKGVTAVEERASYLASEGNGPGGERGGESRRDYETKQTLLGWVDKGGRSREGKYLERDRVFRWGRQRSLCAVHEKRS